MRRRAMMLVALPLAVLLTGCAPETGRFAVIDSGDGPQLCTTILESYPPQCGDPRPVLDWDWDDWEHEEASGVRWVEAEFVVTRDGDAVRVEAAEG